MGVELIFPTAIYTDKITDIEHTNEYLLAKIKSIQQTTKSGSEMWISPAYNTLGTHDISKDMDFKILLETITGHVNNFAKILGVERTKKKYECTEAWINIMKKYDFQDYHHHHSNTFSAVYYVTVPEGSSNLVLESPLEPDMCPVAASIPNYMNVMTHDYVPSPGGFIIFRSYIRHCVPRHLIDEDRICIAFNFN